MALDQGRFNALKQIAAQQNRRITPGEYVGAGGNWQDYHRDVPGAMPLSGPVPESQVFNFQQFDQIANQAAQEGRRVTPQEYMSVGGNMQMYGMMYPDQAQETAMDQGAPNFDVNDPNSLYQADFGDRNVSAEMQQYANRPNEVTPTGGANWVVDPSTGQLTRQTYLSENEQKIQQGEAELQQGFQGAVGESLKNLPTGQLDYSGAQQIQLPSFGGIPQAQQGIDTSDLASTTPGADSIQGYRQNVEDQIFNNWMNRNRPLMQQEQEQLEQRMANEGIPRGSEKWNEQLRQMKQRHSDAIQNTQTQATQAGRAEFESQSDVGLRTRGQGLTEKIAEFEASGMSRDRAVAEAQKLFSMEGQKRQQDISEINAQRSEPYQQIGALTQNMRGAYSPNVQQYGNIDFPQLSPSGTGLAYREGEIAKQLGELEAQTRKDVANIQAGAVAGGGGGEGGSYLNLTPSSAAGTKSLQQQGGFQPVNQNPFAGQWQGFGGVPIGGYGY